MASSGAQGGLNGSCLCRHSSSLPCGRCQTLITEVWIWQCPFLQWASLDRMCSWAESCHAFQYFALFVAEFLTFAYVYQIYKIILLWFCIGNHLLLWGRKWKLHEKEMAGQLRNYLCHINRGLISILIFAPRYFLEQSCDLNANLAHWKIMLCCLGVGYSRQGPILTLMNMKNARASKLSFSQPSLSALHGTCRSFFFCGLLVSYMRIYWISVSNQNI